MSIFIVRDDQVQLSIASPRATDTFLNGILTSEDGFNRAQDANGEPYSNGLLLTNDGQVQYVDATGGLPADVQWCNGLPMAEKGLCISTDRFFTYSNGVPFAENGAVSVVLTP